MKTRFGVSLGLLILRLTFGLYMLLGHGLPKLQSFADKAAAFPDPLGIGSRYSLIATVVAEVGCAILLILGFGTRIGALILAFTMFIALFVVHEADPWKVKELAAVYLAAYCVLFISGAGPFSLDYLFLSDRNEEVELD